MKKLLFLLSGTLLPFHAAAQQAIDVHCHNVLPGFVSFLESHDATSDEGYPLPKWDAESHIRFMQEAGIGLSVLSMPAPQPYFGNSDECRRVIRNYNDECARLKSACPGKFLFCASLPLPDVKAAVDEAVYALDTLGADGILYGNAAKLFSIKESSYSNASSLANAKDTQKTDARGKLQMQADGIVRLSKIEVYPEHLDEYMKFATEVGEISLRTEPGVLTMYAVAEKEDPCRITILETYASQAAYKSHIASKHFRKYKQGTLHMVKSLVLSDQTPLNPANVIENFIKK
jgi:quinol monooxygenase YgiN